MTARWGEPQPGHAPALLEAAGHSATALLVAILLVCAAGIAWAL